MWRPAARTAVAGAARAFAAARRPVIRDWADSYEAERPAAPRLAPEAAARLENAVVVAHLPRMLDLRAELATRFAVDEPDIHLFPNVNAQPAYALLLFAGSAQAAAALAQHRAQLGDKRLRVSAAEAFFE